MTISSAQPLQDTQVGEAAATHSPPLEWWYLNAVLDAPGTPVDGMMLLGMFVRLAGFSNETRALLVSPDFGTVAEFGSGQLPVDAIVSTTDRLDVRNGPSYLRGGYPDYDFHLDGRTADGTNCVVALTYEADIAPERMGYIDSQLEHFVVYRMKATGTVTIGADTYPVRGVGYFEHLLGTMGWREPFVGLANPPHFIDGWNWYWSPAAGPEGVAVMLGTVLVDGEAHPVASVSADGKNFTLFTEGTSEVLEERTHGGLTYPHKLRIRAGNDGDEIDLVITRRDSAHRTERRAPGGARLVFVTGFVEFEGKALLGGVEHDLSSRAWGSFFRLAMPPHLRAIKNLPNAVRVPLGRGIARLLQLTGRT